MHTEMRYIEQCYMQKMEMFLCVRYFRHRCDCGKDYLHFMLNGFSEKENRQGKKTLESVPNQITLIVRSTSSINEKCAMVFFRGRTLLFVINSKFSSQHQIVPIFISFNNIVLHQILELTWVYYQMCQGVCTFRAGESSKNVLTNHSINCNKNYGIIVSKLWHKVY